MKDKSGLDLFSPEALFMCFVCLLLAAVFWKIPATNPFTFIPALTAIMGFPSWTQYVGVGWFVVASYVGAFKSYGWLSELQRRRRGE